MTEQLCPECGADLSTRDARKHAIAHYGERAIDATANPEGSKRQKALLELGKQTEAATPAAKEEGR